ncbi:hypothetical protein WJX72_000419 [[Myrmecia] bisecta]|uniref:Non-structural maintenance of chromosomes element 4 n=1 Tax=[Myrmecia] bisecta TaxID=41462 RepID=A0AAW1Q0B8_9CHLO
MGKDGHRHGVPLQDEASARNLRIQLNKFKQEIRKDKDKLVSNEGNVIVERLKKLNDISKDVQRPREQAADAEAFSDLATLAKEGATKLAQGGKGRSITDFLRRLKARYVHSSEAQEDGALDPEAFNWAALGQHVNKYFKTAPGVCCMLGPLDAQPKVRKVAQRMAKKPPGKLINPDQQQEARPEDMQETDKNMEVMYSMLASHPRAHVLEVILNHESYAQTVENMFALSFLVKDARVKLENSDDGMVVIWQTSKKKKKDKTGEGAAAAEAPEVEAAREQFVIASNMDDWETWKQYVDPKDCLMPHREELATAGPSNLGRADEEAGPSRRDAGQPAANGGRAADDAAEAAEERGSGNAGDVPLPTTAKRPRGAPQAAGRPSSAAAAANGGKAKKMGAAAVKQETAVKREAPSTQVGRGKQSRRGGAQAAAESDEDEADVIVIDDSEEDEDYGVKQAAKSKRLKR